MSDIVRSPNDKIQRIIRADPALQMKRLKIELAEKTNHFEAIRVQVDNLKYVKVPQLELQQDCLAKEIAEVKAEMMELGRQVGGDSDAVDAEFVVK